MINLLPPQLKEEYYYARRNSSLMRWVMLFGLGLIGLAIISTAGGFYLHQQAKTYTAQVASAQQDLKDQNQHDVQKQVQDISSSLKLAVQVLSKEVLFSNLLKRLAVVTPQNVSLSNLSINQAQSSVDITAKTADYNAATQLQVNLIDPNNQIFDKADIVSITCAAPAAGQSNQYPCTVIVRALFAANSPFLFISNKPAGKS